MTAKSRSNCLSKNGITNIASALDHIGLRLISTFRRTLNTKPLLQEEPHAIIARR